MKIETLEFIIIHAQSCNECLDTLSVYRMWKRKMWYSATNKSIAAEPFMAFHSYR